VNLAAFGLIFDSLSMHSGRGPNIVVTSAPKHARESTPHLRMRDLCSSGVCSRQSSASSQNPTLVSHVAASGLAIAAKRTAVHVRRPKHCRRRHVCAVATPSQNSGDAPTAASSPRWQAIAGCQVLLPRSQPTLLLQFTGAAFVSTAPLPFYRGFLEHLSHETSAAIVVTPYTAVHDLDASAESAATSFEAVLQELLEREVSSLRDLPVYSLGHSLGCVIALLIMEKRSRAGAVLISFTQRAILDMMPVPLPSLPENGKPLAAALGQVLDVASGEPRVTQGFATVGTILGLASNLFAKGKAEVALVQTTMQSAGTLLSQASLLLNDIASGSCKVRPTRMELAERLRRNVRVQRTLLVEFSDDAFDETPWLLSVFGCEEVAPEEDENSSNRALEEAIDRALDEAIAEAFEAEAFEAEFLDDWNENVEEAVYLEDAIEPIAGSVASEAHDKAPQVERTRLSGSHMAPLEMSGGDAGSPQSLVAAVGRFLRQEKAVRWPCGLVEGSQFALKEQLLRMVAGTAYGPTTSRRRSELLKCISELEKLSPVSKTIPNDCHKAAAPERIFGCWRLVWTNAQDVLVASSLPFVECGEIVQEIRKSTRIQEDIDVLTTLTFSQRGSGLLGMLPLAADAAGAQVSIRAHARPESDRTLSLQPGAATASPAFGWPKLPLLLPPILPSAGSSLLLTAFLDDELRVGRSSVGDTFVWLRVR